MASIGTNVNCGFARVAMKELSENVDEFKRLFQHPLHIPDEYFDSMYGGKKSSRYIVQCNQIKAAFLKRWQPSNAREQYKATFSLLQWDRLAQTERVKHSLEKCNACFCNYYTIQKTFPLKPCYTPCEININLANDVNQETFIQVSLEALNSAASNRYKVSYIDMLIEHKIVDKHKSKADIKKAVEDTMKKCKKNIENELDKTVPITLMKENESLASYNRKRIAEYYTTPPASKKKKMSHSPNFDGVQWDKEEVLQYLREVETKDEKVVWSTVAQEHGIEGHNKGQILKEFAAKNGINTAKISACTITKHTRKAKKKFPGGKVSIPVPPTTEAITSAWKKMVDSGELMLGVPCSPYTITSYKNDKGRITVENKKIEGRKIPLHDVRSKLLEKQETYMHLYSDSKIKGMGIDELQSAIKVFRPHFDATVSIEELKAMLKTAQRTRTLAFWHDHATILGHGYILMTVHVIYDAAVFMQDKAHNIQTIVEEPYIYLFALNSSTIEDQAGLIADRVECLSGLNDPLIASNGVPVHDVIRFFVGDHPAQQFEGGTQVGGIYKCGACGCKDKLMDDQAHSLNCKTRSLTDLHALAIGGKLGKVPCKVKPLYVPDLLVNDIRKELTARKVAVDTTQPRDVLQKTLQEILQGVQRVPSLLLLHPEKKLKDINLEHYTILACEPLHDLKCHLINLFSELPSVLPSCIKAECTQHIKKCLSREKKKAAELRATVIQLYHMIRACESGDWKVRALLESIVRISEIMYAHDSERSPKMILRLYNNVWLHHELCYDLFQMPESRNALFGLYLHSISRHAAEQYEIVCLRSGNTENQERLFGQCRRTAESVTNRHPANIITNVMLRMQAKQIGTTKANGATIVTKAAKGIPKYPGTHIPIEFVNAHKDSWQAHLEKISPFLIHGETVWWTETESKYIFNDGVDSPNQPLPELLHFRDSSLLDVQRRRIQCWKYIIENDIKLPAPSIKIYGCDEEFLYTKEYLQLPDHQSGISSDETPEDQNVISDQYDPPGISNDPSNATDMICSSHYSDQISAPDEQPIIMNTNAVTSSDHTIQTVTSVETTSSDHTIQTVTSVETTSSDHTIKTVTSVETTVAKAISNCIGITEEVQQLDKLRKDLKILKHSNQPQN